MKKAWKWVLCLALAVTMLCCVALAADAPEIAYGDGMSTGSITVAADDTITVTVPASMISANEQYVIIMVKVQGDTASELLTASYELGADTITYINQTAATSEGVTFSGKPSVMTSCVLLLGGKDGSGQDTSARVLGAIKTQGVTVTGTATAKGDTSVNVTVTIKDGSATVGTATVTSGGSYTISGVPAQAGLTVEVSATNYATREYTLDTAAADALDVEICHNGDATKDGRLMINDISTLYGHYMETRKMTDAYAIQCGANVVADNKLMMNDVSTLYSHFMETRQIAAWNGWGLSK